MTNGYRKVNRSKIGRRRSEMIREKQPELELQETVAFIYPSVTKI